MNTLALKKVLLLGSGGLRIGQAGEFDYSGSQAIKALKEENIEVVLVNPNIATVQTDPNMADKVYLQPLNSDIVTNIIEKEQPDAILLGFGGQTALNLGLKLADLGVLAKHNVKVLGTSTKSIKLAEDRALFKQELQTIEIKTPVSVCVDTVEDALTAAKEIGFPVMVRSGFTLGGMGSGIIHNPQDLRKLAQATLSGAPHILVEEYLCGWSEFEYEIIRDVDGNTLTICNMENMDPMGIHTGESIVVAPSQSLTNEQYHFLRKISLDVANHFGIIGECNIQFAFNLNTGDYRVIEINPRLSRSSALASKATGYPLAFVATKLALGYRLHEIKNSITQKTCAFFEPALDYIVVKIPRWDTHKLRAAERFIGTEMKSVGEVMAIGRTFPEALQKAVGMLNIGANDLTDYPYPIDNPTNEIAHATDRRLFALYNFFKNGGSTEEAHTLSKINLWFLHHVHSIAMLAKQLNEQTLDQNLLLAAKRLGCTDKSIAKITQQTEADIRQLRLQHGITPYIKQIDTLAGEFDAQTNYLYLTYHGCEHDLAPSSQPAVIVLGSGPYSIGSSVEFDWCGVNTSRTLRRLGEQSIIINSNPETVSTDYDESDRLYFEQLSFERVQDIADFENLKGIIVSVGGQVANNLALPLHEAGYPILGTAAQSINQAENRQLFSSLLNKLHIDQPAWSTADSIDNAQEFAAQVGYPVLIRPSFVLSGAAMNIVFNDTEMQQYLEEASLVSPDHPVVISKFIQNAKELQIDGVADHGNVIVEAISEHIENAGVHSGDATIVMPPQRLYLETIRNTKKIMRKIVKALNITGPFNIQFLAKDNKVRVIECNLRASRSFPFASKVANHNFIAVSTEIMLDRYKPAAYETLELDYVGVKSPQFSYNRLKGANPVAHVEMASTGEVACLGDNLLQAFYHSWQATEKFIDRKKIFLSIGGDKKSTLLNYIKKLAELDWEIFTTGGTHDFLAVNGVASLHVFKASKNIEPSVASIVAQRKVDLIINIPNKNRNYNHQQTSDGYLIRRLAIDHNIPLITNLQSALLTLQCLTELDPNDLAIKSWQEFIGENA